MDILDRPLSGTLPEEEPGEDEPADEMVDEDAGADDEDPDLDEEVPDPDGGRAR